MKTISGVAVSGNHKGIPKLALIRARRTAFVSKLIILRENKISRAHSILERLHWDDTTTYWELYKVFYRVLRLFEKPVNFKRDLDQAREHAKNLSPTFVREYANRSGQSFLEALIDYEKSIYILFGAEYLRTLVGWAPASIVARSCAPIHIKTPLRAILGEVDLACKPRKKSLAHNQSKKSAAKIVETANKVIDGRKTLCNKITQVKPSPKRAAS